MAATQETPFGIVPGATIRYRRPGRSRARTIRVDTVRVLSKSAVVYGWDVRRDGVLYSRDRSGRTFILVTPTAASRDFEVVLP